MPNPAGINAFGGPFEHEQPYGAIEKMKQLTQGAPIGSPQALNAPRRSQAHAKMRGRTGGTRPTAATGAAPQTPPPVQQPPSYQDQLIGFWQEMSASPNASPLVRQYATEVLGGLAGKAA